LKSACVWDLMQSNPKHKRFSKYELASYTGIMTPT
jgi:hypothetical protein